MIADGDHNPSWPISYTVFPPANLSASGFKAGRSDSAHMAKCSQERRSAKTGGDTGKPCTEDTLVRREKQETGEL